MTMDCSTASIHSTNSGRVSDGLTLPKWRYIKLERSSAVMLCKGNPSASSKTVISRGLCFFTLEKKVVKSLRRSVVGRPRVASMNRARHFLQLNNPLPSLSTIRIKFLARRSEVALKPSSSMLFASSWGFTNPELAASQLVKMLDTSDFKLGGSSSNRACPRLTLLMATCRRCESRYARDWPVMAFVTESACAQVSPVTKALDSMP
mmetsp:Transcript_144834/g.204960  ORF Transcript_144834/g.204960 Transcript_144834/m.204960 type:complete len:206 (-) Transcript_144834:424-1041(-)